MMITLYILYMKIIVMMMMMMTIMITIISTIMKMVISTSKMMSEGKHLPRLQRK